MWDAPVLLCAADRPVIMFAADELRHRVVMHWTLHKIWNAIYLRRGEGDLAALEQAVDILRRGGRLGLSPEGHRSRAGLQQAFTGVAYLAYRAGVPTVPVAVYGQERIVESWPPAAPGAGHHPDRHADSSAIRRSDARGAARAHRTRHAGDRAAAAARVPRTLRCGRRRRERQRQRDRLTCDRQAGAVSPAKCGITSSANVRSDSQTISCGTVPSCMTRMSSSTPAD